MHEPGYGSVTVGERGTGGMHWHMEAAMNLDIWVTALPAGVQHTAAPIYRRYADATGHAPVLPREALLFWQSRLRYKTSDVVVDIVRRYQEMQLPVGVVVVDYHNQVIDGDFLPDPACYPSLQNLSAQVKEALNATLMFSIWPEVQSGAVSMERLKKEGCLINAALDGFAIDTTMGKCRQAVWSEFVKPNYADNGVAAFWLDETDGEGTGGVDGEHGYDVSLLAARVSSNLWVNSWLRTFTEPLAAGGKSPLALVRGVWAGGQRHGVVLWSSDIESTFEELTAQINLGVHASLSGIPWWTSDVGGFGCNSDREFPNDSRYMQELIVRWYQFGLFCPIFRTHGCRKGAPAPEDALQDPCLHGRETCAGNEVWSYGPKVQKLLEGYIRTRAQMHPYLLELADNVTREGVPTMRPLWWEFPQDWRTYNVEDQYMLGPDLLVAPVTQQGAISRAVYFPQGAIWQHFFNASIVMAGGHTALVAAPLEEIPVYRRMPVANTALEDPAAGSTIV